jgi:hypothetical protein
MTSIFCRGVAHPPAIALFGTVENDPQSWWQVGGIVCHSVYLIARCRYQSFIHSDLLNHTVDANILAAQEPDGDSLYVFA